MPTSANLTLQSTPALVRENLAKYRDLGLRVRFITSDEHRAGRIAEIAGEEDAKFHYGVFDEVWFFSTFYISLDHRRASSRIGRKSAPDLL